MNPTLFAENPILLEPCTKVNPVQTAQIPLAIKLKMRLWAVIQSTIFRFSPSLFRAYRRWLLGMFGAKLAKNASIHQTARIDCPWNLEMGEFASIGEHAWVYSLDKIFIESYVCVGQRAVLLTGTHDFTLSSFPLVTKPIHLLYGSWIATGATILPGVTVEALCVIGAASVVTRSMPAQMVCAGNPCKPLKKRELKAA
jgi:putative colanic acid biosynthesis acetyltransferase WcaF